MFYPLQNNFLKYSLVIVCPVGVTFANFSYFLLKIYKKWLLGASPVTFHQAFTPRVAIKILSALYNYDMI